MNKKIVQKSVLITLMVIFALLLSGNMVKATNETGMPKSKVMAAASSEETPVAAPTNVKATKSGNTITLTWDAVEGAEIYNVYIAFRDTGTDEMKYYEAPILSKITTNSCKLTSKSQQLLSNEAYFVVGGKKVGETYQLGYISDYATYRANLPAPSGVKITNQNGKVKITWNKVEEASAYEIYNGNTLVKRTTGTSATVTDLSSSKSYTLKVRAYVNDEFYKEKLYGKFASKNAFPNVVSNVKTTLVGKTNVKVTWSKRSNVTGYKVYRSTSKTSGYKEIKKITSKNTNSFTDKGLKKGTTYYYKVVPYLNTVNGGDSNIANMKTFTDAKITGVGLKTEAGSKVVYVSWKKSSNNIDGYEVYRATSKNGKYKKVKGISSIKTVSLTDKGLKKTTKYYYKIRGYKKINGKTYYTKYSDIKNIKTSYIKNETKMPHKAYTYYKDCFTAKSVSLKYKKNSGSKAVYDVKMKVQIKSTARNDVYYTVDFYDKKGKKVGSKDLQFSRKIGNYTKTVTFKNVKVPTKAVSFKIR